MSPTTVDALSTATDRPDSPVTGARLTPDRHASRLAARLGRAKLAYTTRHVPVQALQRLIEVDPDGDAAPRPRAGDLVLARVESIGHHKRIELANGRRATLFEGDEIVVCYANRYAPDQFEAEAPADLGPCDLVAAGGVAARMVTRSSRVGDPTAIVPIGLLADAGCRRVNLRDWALSTPPQAMRRPHTIAVLGTAMNAGKTTTAANLIRGLVRGGRQVGAAKVTGTGAGGDLWLMSDSGAHPVLDFTHSGHASTYRVAVPEIVRSFELLLGHLSRSVETAVIEVADGLCQAETVGLVDSPAFRAAVDAVVFSAPDALGAAHGVRMLEARGIEVAAISGALTASPLAMRETQALTGLPVLDIEALREPDPLGAGVARAKPERGAGASPVPGPPVSRAA
jgi:hypothetical protein